MGELSEIGYRTFLDQDGWPVRLDKLASWDRKSERLFKNDAIFHFFACPCMNVRGGNRRPHRMSACKYLDTQRGAADDPSAEKRLRAMTTPISL